MMREAAPPALSLVRDINRPNRHQKCFQYLSQAKLALNYTTLNDW